MVSYLNIELIPWVAQVCGYRFEFLFIPNYWDARRHMPSRHEHPFPSIQFGLAWVASFVLVICSLAHDENAEIPE